MTNILGSSFIGGHTNQLILPNIPLSNDGVVLLAVGINIPGGGGSISNVSDNFGNKYNEIGTVVYQEGCELHVFIADETPPGSLNVIVDFTISGPVAAAVVVLDDDVYGAVDLLGNGSSGFVSNISDSVSTRISNDLVVLAAAYVYSPNEQLNPGSNLSIIQQGSSGNNNATDVGLVIGAYVAGSPGVQSPYYTFSGPTNPWTAFAFSLTSPGSEGGEEAGGSFIGKEYQEPYSYLFDSDVKYVIPAVPTNLGDKISVASAPVSPPQPVLPPVIVNPKTRATGYMGG